MAVSVTLPPEFEKELECSICQEMFKDPRFLTCSHSFCLLCLERLSEGKAWVSCPLCREETGLPLSGATGLTKNNLAQTVVAKLEEHKKDAPTDSPAMCQSGDDEHESPEKAMFYCESCRKAVCPGCVVVYHRDPLQHPTTHVDLVLVRMKREIHDMLDQGQLIEAHATECITTSIKLREDGITARMTDLRSQIDSAFGEERRMLQNRERTLSNELKDVEFAVKAALMYKQSASEKEAKSIADLNHLAEDMLQGAPAVITEMYETICHGYQVQMQSTTLDETTASLARISELISGITFQKETSTMARINVTSGPWTVDQARFPVKQNWEPSAFVEMSDGLIAVGFGTSSDIKVYDRQFLCIQSFGPVVVKHMTPLPKRSLMVLTDEGDVFRFSSPDQSGTRLLRGTTLKDNAFSLIADIEGNFSLLYKDRVEMYSKVGKLLQTASLPLHLHGISFEAHLGKRINGNNHSLDVLIDDEKAVRLIKIVVFPTLQIHATDLNLPEAVLGVPARSITLDSDGNLFVALVKDNHSVTIKKYWGCDPSSEEMVITDLQMVMDEDDHVLLSALSPSCLVMSSPQKLSVFRKDSMEQFLIQECLV